MKSTAVLGGLLVCGALWASPAAGQEQSQPSPFNSCEHWADEDLKACTTDPDREPRYCQEQHAHDVKVCRDLYNAHEKRRKARERRAKQQG